VRRLQVICLVVFGIGAVSLAAGCGGGGTADGATVSVYAAAPLCREARRSEGRADDLVVRVVCLQPVERGGEADLAAAGANARRATGDSTSVAFLEAPGPAAKFSRSIVESADIAWVETSSGGGAMKRILSALDGGSSSPRKTVLDEVG
jgi:hypothetical protein